MLIVYATMQSDYAMENSYRRLNPIFDNEKLQNKIVVTNEEYFFRNIDYLNNIRIILITKNNLSKTIDVECFKSLNHLINNNLFDDKELYLIGDYKFLKEALFYADKIITNIVDDKIDNPTKYFPNIDENIWQLTKIKEETPRINKLVYRK